MRLDQFISIQREAILEAWDSFADTLQPDTRVMGARELRDHAEQMLVEIAADISTPQSIRQGVENPAVRDPRPASTRHRRCTPEPACVRASVSISW